MKDYEINEQTLALVPHGERHTRVYEVNNTFLVNKPITEVMEDSCQYFGSSLLGRQKGTTNLIGVSHKAPIIVEETKELIFFPTTSPRLTKCSWLSLRQINRYYYKNKKMYVQFKNNTTIEVNVSYGVLDNQILRATRLESVLRNRKELTKNI